MSTLKVNAVQNTSGVEMYLAKAWVNFNGTGTVAIRASGNVSSITDNGAGDYTVNFSSAMPDANYCAVGASGTTASDYRVVVPNFNAAPTASACRIRVGSMTQAAADDTYVNFTIFR